MKISAQLLELLEEAKNHILVATGDGARLVSEIIVPDNGEGLLLILAEEKTEQQDDSDETAGETITEVTLPIDADTVKLIRLRLLTQITDEADRVITLSEVTEKVRKWPDWMKVELTNKIGCTFNKLPMLVAEFYKKETELAADGEKTAQS